MYYPCGRWSCENPETLQRDLKERMGFKGWVLSDYGGTHSQSMNACLDMEMPGSSFLNATGLNTSLHNGALKLSKVDDSVLRILTGLFSIGLFDKPNTNTPLNNVATAEHHATAAELSAAGTVLLVNRGNLLPLCPPSMAGPLCQQRTVDVGGTRRTRAAYTIAVIGHEALGVTVAGGGSGHVTPSNLTGPLAAIRARFGIRNASQPCSASTSDRGGGGGGGGSVCVQFADTTKAADIPTAVALAQTADVSIVFVATSAAEGIDRDSLCAAVTARRDGVPWQRARATARRRRTGGAADGDMQLQRRI